MTNGIGRSSAPISSTSRIALGVVCLWLAAISGCNGHRPNFGGSGSLLARNGSLKAGLSQIQFENDTLKAQIAKLEKQNRQLLADLQREESHSGTLAARLDESRNLLRGRGVNVPLDTEDPRIVARAEAAGTAPRTTFGDLRTTRPRRSRYADPDPTETETEIPENDDELPAKPKGKQPPSFPDDPPSLDKFGEEVPELSANDVSTGWRRLSYRDLRQTTPLKPPR